MTLLICPVRPGANNPELRYALRSWETNLHLDSMELMTVGYCPPWLKPEHHVEGNRYASVPLAVWDNVGIASREAGCCNAIYMNDDFFALKPVEQVLPMRRDMTLRQHIEVFPQNVGMWWPKSLRTTEEFLASKGFLDPWSYELHKPLIANTQMMLEALMAWQGGFDSLPQWRTLYGVLNQIKAEPVADAKLGLVRSWQETDWVSTSDSSWRIYGAQIAPRFQKPSRWELDAV